MKNLRLNERQLGSEFCRFERDLIFKEDLVDVGFVRHINSRTFKLQKSKFTEIDSGKVYVLPQDGSIDVDEGSFIRIEVGKEMTDVRPISLKANGLDMYQKKTIAQVTSVSEAKVPLPPPGIPVDEFLYRVSRGSKDASEDMLDYIIAFLMISSPRSIFGNGGLGSEGVQRERTTLKGSSKDLANTILSQLPVEFRTTGTAHYKYSKIEGMNDIRLVRPERISESCYSLVPDRIYEAMVSRKVPIQLPFVIRNSHFLNRNSGIDLDVLDYQLTGFYMPPPSERIQEEIFLKTMKEMKNEEFWDIKGVGELDRSAGLKINLAMSRLLMGRRFDGNGYRPARTDPAEGLDLFRKIMRYGFENMRSKIQEEDYFRSQKTEPWRGKLKAEDKELYMKMRNIVEETGKFEFDSNLVITGRNQRSIEESLQRLNKYGYVLFMKGGSVIKLVVSEDPEELE